MEIYERYGRLREGFEVTLELLRALKSGDIDIKRVSVEADGWSLEPEEDDAGN